jgi:hypothetical protein
MCRQTKPVTDFAWRRIKKSQRDSYCRPCRSIYKKEHYRRNKDRYIHQARAFHERIYLHRTEWLLDYFMLHPCVDCGESDPVVLEFDHLRDKRTGITKVIANGSWAKFLAEIEKCEVVCVNCHRRRTAERGGFARLLFMVDDEIYDS